ncbi:AbrB/MazE/SpoVT family DNA-binding domain-containing protein [Quadrisphaera sp. DSM 44207]|uniref:AbrB/MazE/SpoVT family DNA-binding domain-containing protein n=1 Tax=Quadrisphaera sp. DSM 44207 TaxID=1881057 RepID=UPI000B85C244|nr:AbrB/MazE/SpoVT family DNA-binding domain-containing protein [Quadrisphaera sp. DSM 44207]
MSHAQVDGRWRLTVPPDVRAALRLAPGEDVVFTLDDRGGARLVSRRALIAELRGSGGEPGAVDELIARRREEAAREDELAGPPLDPSAGTGSEG